MFRSQTDEQLAARWDDEPWVNSAGGQRANEQINEWYEFAPRIECIPSRDPKPYGCDEGHGECHRSRIPNPGFSWAPRPEFARPPVNGILVAFRHPRAATIWQFLAGLNQPEIWWPEMTPVEIVHARKVLERLANLT